MTCHEVEVGGLLDLVGETNMTIGGFASGSPTIRAWPYTTLVSVVVLYTKIELAGEDRRATYRAEVSAETYPKQLSFL